MGGGSNEVDFDHEVAPIAKPDTFRRLIDEDEWDIDEPQSDPPIGPSSSASNSPEFYF